METFTVVWRDKGDDYMVTVVELPDDHLGFGEATNDWVDLAAAKEAMVQAERTGVLPEADAEEYLPSRDGYDLILVARGELDFVY